MLGRFFVIITIIIMLALPAAPARAQAESCVVIYVGSGYGPVTVAVPSWATRLRAYVEWRGLQLRFFVDGVVHGTALNNEAWVQTAINTSGWGGIREIKFGGLVGLRPRLDAVRLWLAAANANAKSPNPNPNADDRDRAGVRVAGR